MGAGIFEVVNVELPPWDLNLAIAVVRAYLGSSIDHIAITEMHNLTNSTRVWSITAFAEFDKWNFIAEKLSHSVIGKGDDYDWTTKVNIGREIIERVLREPLPTSDIVVASKLQRWREAQAAVAQA